MNYIVHTCNYIHLPTCAVMIFIANLPTDWPKFMKNTFADNSGTIKHQHAIWRRAVELPPPPPPPPPLPPPSSPL